VVQNNKPILNGNPCVEVGYLDDASKFSPLHSALSVPLEGLSDVMGALTLYRSDADAFNKDHVRVLLAISSKIALSVENAIRFQHAESSATIDFLTGLPNAGSLFLHLDQELARCRRTQTQVCVMLCDLNGFKAINDRFGHLEGNKVLRLFAHSLKGICREYDYVARMGGDEFVIIAPGLTPEAAVAKAERINSFAVAAGQEVCGTNLLSASVGSAFSLPDGMDPEQLLAEADRRMYSVKREYYDCEAGITKLSTTSCATVVQ
jgi:diguanylate cyclase (GGDEF)-like protein